MLVETALRDQYGDQDSFDRGADQAAAACPLDHQPEQRRAANQHDHRHDAAFPAGGLAAGLAVELAVEEGDRASGEDHGMRDMAEDRRHVAEHGVDDEACDEQQQRIGNQRRHAGRGRIGR